MTLGAWVQTASGKKLHPLSPCEGTVEIWDIAHHLSQIVRFNGAAPVPHTVARHSILVSLRAEELAVGNGAEPALAISVALQGLLHDAAEFILGDVTRPLKKSLALPELGVELADLEAAWLGCILRRFRLPDTLHAWVLRADEDILATEAAVFFPKEERPADWKLAGEVLPRFAQAILEPWGYLTTRMEFLERWRSLGK